MILEIDHLVVAARDPEGAADDLAAALGLARVGGGVHASIGTRNALLSLAGPYLELIGLQDDDPATRARALRHPLGAAVVGALDATDHGRYAYVTAALRSDDLASDVGRLADLARATGRVARAAVLTASEVVRQRPDGSVLRWPVAFPPRLGPEDPPFLIEHAPDEPERAARIAGGGMRLAGIEIPVADPKSVTGAWRATCAIAFEPAPRARGDARGAWVARVGPHEVVVSAARQGDPVIVRLVASPRQAGRVADCGGVVLVPA